MNTFGNVHGKEHFLIQKNKTSTFLPASSGKKIK